MYRGFQLNVTPSTFEGYKSLGKLIYEGHERIIRPDLKEFVQPNGALNGSKMQAKWFRQIDADVFISHSHLNKDLALAMAGWLRDKLHLTAFIDSAIWDYADDLLWELDVACCRPAGQETFSYESRNYSTAHVHMMLNNALSKMIDRCECLFFLKTPESTVSNIIEQKTNSPWIYAEISMSQLIKKTTPDRPFIAELTKAQLSARNFSESAKSRVLIEHDLELAHLSPLTDTSFKNWDYSWNALHLQKTKSALDRLYKQNPLPEKAV